MLHGARSDKTPLVKVMVSHAVHGTRRNLTGRGHLPWPGEK